MIIFIVLKKIKNSGNFVFRDVHPIQNERQDFGP